MRILLSSPMIPRKLSAKLLELARHNPVVAVTGPRQVGKTTLCRATFTDKPYVSLESLDLREFAAHDPRGFLHEYRQGQSSMRFNRRRSWSAICRLKSTNDRNRGVSFSPARSIWQYLRPSPSRLPVAVACSPCCPLISMNCGAFPRSGRTVYAALAGQLSTDL